MTTTRSACALVGLALAAVATADPGKQCLVASGGSAVECVARYAAALRDCHEHPSPGCDATLHAPGGKLESLLAATERPVRRRCTAEAADKLTFLAGLDDLVARTAQACRKWGEDLVRVSEGPDVTGSAAGAFTCRKAAGTRLAQLHDRVVRAYGRGCYVAEFAGERCDGARRDRRVERARSVAASRLRRACGVASETVLDTVVDHARHLAQRVYPPLDLGPSGLLGQFPVGVRTLHLIDASRSNVAGTGPRPIEVEVYYPSTAAAVAGVDRDRPLSLFTTPAHRDVGRAAGTFPLVVFSPGQGSEPWMYVYLAAHLASHGYVVASIAHHGDRLRDQSDPDPLVNRPIDVSAVLDQLLARAGQPGDFFEGAIDATRIGAAGHSRGGYTAMALATCPFGRGAFADARVKAILSSEGSVPFSTSAPGVFSTITIPTLLVAGSSSHLGSIDQIAFDALTPGPTIMAFASLHGAFHDSGVTDNCEVPDAILELFTGGPVKECEPGAVPWRYARHVSNYLALNFFDATLRGDADALGRLDPTTVAAIEDVTYRQKPSSSTAAPVDETCTLPCGDGTVGPSEVCDPPGAQGVCATGETCNVNCTACVTCAGATVIPPEGGVIDGTTSGGTAGFGSTCGFDVFAPERLFVWTPSVAHLATIETCGGATDYDTTLYVRSGTCLAPDLACNDDGATAGCGLASRVTVDVLPGVPYYIVVDGFGVAGGNFTLRVM